MPFAEMQKTFDRRLFIHEKARSCVDAQWASYYRHDLEPYCGVTLLVAPAKDLDLASLQEGDRAAYPPACLSLSGLSSLMAASCNRAACLVLAKDLQR